MRVGMGYDVHKLVENRKLILGGVEIPYEYGLLGHSDADVLVHAIMDALLGAAALRDIGRHFPDNDPAYEGADSIELLKKVGEMLEERMYLIENIDATVIAQKPKLLPYIDTMVKNVAEALHLEEDQVNIKATTEEGLGFTGKKEGISAQAICCISKALDLMPDDRIAGGCSGCPGKERRRIKEKCDCTRPEDVVDWKKNKGVVGGIRDAIRPTTEEKAFLLALYEMTRLICINKYGADRSFSI